jgi:protein ImuA
MPKMSIVDQLRSQIRSLEHATFESRQQCVSSLFSNMDAWLPQAGFVLGSFVEILQDTHGVGSYAFALRVARAVKDSKPTWAVLDTEATFNPSVAKAYGWDARKLILVRAAPQDGGWCFAQLLRSKDIGACFWSSSSMDNMVFRRLQLAAERGGGLAFVIRPIAALRKPCWGSLRLHVVSCSSNKIRLRLLHARGQPNVSRDEIEVAL